ncbi:MAG: biotin synthase BioB [Lentisphaeria bacterium]
MDSALSASLAAVAETGQPLEPAAARAVLDLPAADLPALFAVTSHLRERRFGRHVQLCSILNARCGACSEDCAFCAQAAAHDTGVETTPLASRATIHAALAEAETLPVSRLGVVTAGEALSDAEVERIAEAFRTRRSAKVHWCASLGCLTADQLRRLKDAGMTRFHHNLETAESFFPAICTTHSYAKRLATVRATKAAGLEICCGGILGLGESPDQRVEFALTLAREQVEAIPLNFLVAIPGTRLAQQPPLPPLEILRCVALFRLTNPQAEIKVCAGRLLLRDLQSQIFLAGASGMMVGRLLTVAGRDVPTDLQLLADLELEPEPAAE